MHTNLVVWAVLGALLASPAASAGAIESLLATDSTFSALSLANGRNAAFLFYGADGVRLFRVGGEPPIYGRVAAVECAVKRNDAGAMLRWTPEDVERSGDGGAGWIDGAWTFLGAPDAGLRAARLPGII